MYICALGPLRKVQTGHHCSVRKQQFLIVVLQLDLGNELNCRRIYKRIFPIVYTNTSLLWSLLVYILGAPLFKLTCKHDALILGTNWTCCTLEPSLF